MFIHFLYLLFFKGHMVSIFKELLYYIILCHSSCVDTMVSFNIVHCCNVMYYIITNYLIIYIRIYCAIPYYVVTYCIVTYIVLYCYVTIYFIVLCQCIEMYHGMWYCIVPYIVYSIGIYCIINLLSFLKPSHITGHRTFFFLRIFVQTCNKKAADYITS